MVKEKRTEKILLILLVFLALTINLSFLSLMISSEDDFFGEIEIHFIDVGQADSTLIKTEEIVILIDSGYWQRRDVLNYLEGINVTELNLLVGTHPHADHIGQMSLIIENLEVEEIWMSGSEIDSNTYRRTYELILEENLGYKEPRSGQRYEFENVKIDILNPVELTNNIHESCLAMKVSFGDFSVMFTGDVEGKTEREIIERNKNSLIEFFNKFLPERYKFDNGLDVTVYQLGHHGSKTSSTKEFLELMNLEIGIYSAGEGNQYGHPDLEIVEKFNQMNIPLYGTDEHGTIILYADSNGDFEIQTER